MSNKGVLELEPLKDRWERLMLTFAHKFLKNPKIKHLFPPITSIHPMQIRCHEHFQVLHANTERFKNSSIIYMQNLLNNEIKRRRKNKTKHRTYNYLSLLLSPVNSCHSPLILLRLSTRISAHAQTAVWQQSNWYFKDRMSEKCGE